MTGPPHSSAPQPGTAPDPDEWFLDKRGRGNPATRIDQEHPGRQAYSPGNVARPLIHGATYFAELYRTLEETGPGDLVMFTDWQSNADEQLTADPDSALGEVLTRALSRGVRVHALIWRSHTGLIGYTAKEHRDLGELLQEHGGQVLLDMRVRANGAHHQKFVVIRHASDRTRDVAYVGGLDLCHGRRDDSSHLGDPQADEISSEYGERPPWHDIQVALQGPVVRDVETVFRERWADGTPTTRNPLRKAQDAVDDLDEGRRLPEQQPAPEPAGQHAVQLLRTYPKLGAGWSFDFAPEGERSVARGYTKAVRKARRLIYVEDQFMWGKQMSRLLVEALRKNDDLHLIAILPQFPDEDGWFTRDPQLLGRMRAINRVRDTAPDRVAFYGLENHEGTPVYVHAKACVIDDTWASIGSDNFCRRSWTNDSELSAVVLDLSEQEGSEPRYAERLRLTLAAEHLDLLDPDELTDLESVEEARLSAVTQECADPVEMFHRFAESARTLDDWYAGGRPGQRPAGRLRTLPWPKLPWYRIAFAAPWYRYLHDPDGRPSRLRWRERY